MNHPGQELIKLLEELRLRLDNSGVARTNGLLCELGEDCQFYRKSLDIFLNKDFDDILLLLTRAKEKMDACSPSGTSELRSRRNEVK
jgi:hypothetical protein